MKIRNISEALLPRQKVEYYIDRIIRPASRNIFWAQPGTGKSLAFITMGICFSSPEIDNWLGFECKTGKVLFVQEEMPDEGFLEFLEEAYRGFYGGIDKHLPFDFTIYEDMNFSTDKGADKLKDIVSKNGYNFVFVDSFAATISNDENAKKDMQAALDRTKQIITLPSKPAIIFTHHPTRNGEQFRGSGAIGAAMDLIVAIKDKGRNIIEFKMEKNRYKPCKSWETKKVFDKDIHGNDVFILERTDTPSSLEDQQKLMISIIENNPSYGQSELTDAYIRSGGKKVDVLPVLKMLDESEVTEIIQDSSGGRGMKKIRKLSEAYLHEAMSEGLQAIINNISPNGKNHNNGKKSK